MRIGSALIGLVAGLAIGVAAGLQMGLGAPLQVKKASHTPEPVPPAIK